jgi:hypothetical protein
LSNEYTVEFEITYKPKTVVEEPPPVVNDTAPEPVVIETPPANKTPNATNTTPKKNATAAEGAGTTASNEGAANTGADDGSTTDGTTGGAAATATPEVKAAAPVSGNDMKIGDAINKKNGNDPAPVAIAAKKAAWKTTAPPEAVNNALIPKRDRMLEAADDYYGRKL